MFTRSVFQPVINNTAFCLALCHGNNGQNGSVNHIVRYSRHHNGTMLNQKYSVVNDGLKNDTCNTSLINFRTRQRSTALFTHNKHLFVNTQGI